MRYRAMWWLVVLELLVVSTSACEQDGIVARDAGIDAVAVADSGGAADQQKPDQPRDLSPSDAPSAAGWAIAVGGEKEDDIWEAELDEAGNLVVLGSFRVAMRLDGVDGDIELTCSKPGGCTYVAKLDPAKKQFLWGVSIDGSPPAVGVGTDGLGVDAEENIYIAGKFENTAAFGDTTLVSKGDLDVLVVKLDGANGEVVWAKSAGGAGEDDADAVAVGSDGTITICGLFSETASFGDDDLTAAGPNDTFAARLSTDDGSFKWAAQGGADTTSASTKLEYCETIAIDDAGNSYIGGSISGAATFGQHKLSLNDAEENGFVAKLDPKGVFLWAASVGAQRTHDIELGEAGAFYVVAGSRSYFGDLSPPLWDNILLVAKWSPSLSLWDWETFVHASGLSQGTDLLVDDKGNIAVTGWFAEKLPLGSTTLRSTANSVGFLARMDSSGSFTDAESLPSEMLVPFRLVRDKTGGLFVVGKFTGTAKPGGHSLTSQRLDGFIWYSGRGVK